MTHHTSPSQTRSNRTLPNGISSHQLIKYAFPLLVVTLGFNTLRTTVIPYASNFNSQVFCDLPMGVRRTTTQEQQQISTVGAALPASSLICHSNPYAGALQDSLENIALKMDDWMANLPVHQQKAASASMVKHTHERFFPFDANMASCPSTSCVGGKCRNDKSKIVCGLEQLTTTTATTATTSDPNQQCIIYSIGGNNQWQFELDILDKTPCQVHTFDCTGSMKRFQKPENDRLHFHHVCLGTQHEPAPPPSKCGGKSTKCGETWTLLEMQQHLKHDRIDLFKIDIEGFEWNLLESWPELGDTASAHVVLPMQILMEIHYKTQFSDLRLAGLGQRDDFRTPRDMVNLQAHLLRMGYVATERDDNRMCPHCTELTLVRVRCPPPPWAPSTPSLESPTRFMETNSGAGETAAAVVATSPATTAAETSISSTSLATPQTEETVRKLKDMGLEPIFQPETTTDPWKAALFQRLDRIRIACGELCNINTVEALEQHSVPVADQQLPMIRVPNVDCPALLGEAEIDAGDTSAPAIPPELLPLFTQGNAYSVTNAKRLKEIFMGTNSDTRLWPTGNVWKEADIDETVRLIGLGQVKATYSVAGTNRVRDKLAEVDMRGKSVLVIGSSHPWIECICLLHGAAKVTTLEYGTLTSEHPKITAMTPDVFRRKYLAGELETFDGVLSHSSLEHSGLGRYGDALNPWGDILAVARAWCVTKPGGFLYIGVPTGKDLIQSNWHRVYGRLRWPLLTANWSRVDRTGGTELERRGGATSWNGIRAGGWGYLFHREEAVTTTT